MSEQILLGATLIVVKDDCFANSFQEGYLRFKTEQKNRLLTEAEIHSFISTTILNIFRYDRENTGEIIGWIAALLETGTLMYTSVTPVAATLAEQRVYLPFSGPVSSATDGG